MGTEWNEAFDVIVVGTGGSGLAAALTAEQNGMKTLLIEKLDKWGGSTAYSGGGLWVPNNFLMQEQGCLDSEEEALKYMEAIIDDVGPCSSRANKEAFVKHAPKFAEFLRELGFKWVRAMYYPDYYPMVPGAKTGRVIEGDIFDGKKLGPLRKSQLTMEGMPAIPIRSGDAYLLPLAMRSGKAFNRVRRIAGKAISWGIRGKTPLGLGRSLTGQMMYILQKNHQTPVWLNCPLKDIIMEDGKVAGVHVEKDGETRYIKANKGVLLGAGGFPHNKAYRKKYQNIDTDWTSAAPGNTGDGINVAEKLGASLALMDEAWWGGSFYLDGKINFSVYERSLPGCILVDQSGKRFVNESTSYVDLGRKMLDHKGGTPSWLIMDNLHRKRYMFGMMMPGSTPSKYIKDGSIIKAKSLEDLAKQCNLPMENLQETLKKFNSYAYQGIDEEFGRGNDIYDRYYSDPKVLPNSNLAPIENTPFWAIKFYPGDLGTKGGLVTNEYGQVMKEDQTLIEGLYASGNNTASVMGRTYPGPGSTLGPACTFSYIAMNHLAGKK